MLEINAKPNRLKRGLLNLCIIVISVATVVSIARLVEAGSLNPGSAPGSTMYDATAIHNALVGTFDSSAIASSSSGSAIQIARCILERMGGGSC